MSFHPETAYNGSREIEPHKPSPEEIKYWQAYTQKSPKHGRMTEKQVEAHIKSVIR